MVFKKFALLFIAVALMALSACSSNTSRPTTEEVADVIMANGELKKAEATCIAKALLASDLSDETLRKAVDTKGEYLNDEKNLPAEDKAVIENDAALVKETVKCADLVTDDPIDAAGRALEEAKKLTGEDEKTSPPLEENVPGNRPTVEELQAAILKINEPNTNVAIVKCYAEVLISSKLSDATLRKAVETNGEFFTADLSALPVEDQKILTSAEVVQASTACREPNNSNK